ncbi:MAG: DUF4112 domain-containing protein [Bryobacteraceae bacterium]
MPNDRRVDPWLEKLEWVMDRAIPVGPWSFGLDPLLDLVPGVGDALSTVISMAVVVRAFQMRLPKSAIARMTLNIAIDSLVGAIPILGNIFDFAWKSNSMNLAIYRSALAQERDSSSDVAFILAISAAFLFLLAAPFLLIGWLLYKSGLFG